jgi:hypothetical protein
MELQLPISLRRHSVELFFNVDSVSGYKVQTSGDELDLFYPSSLSSPAAVQRTVAGRET